ncbi:MAG: hypothetical protein ACI92Z_000646 [Paracoccaceae bacterium]|jgi:hypothetical protein
MPFDLILLVAAIGLGAMLQVGIGIGFSIIVGPLMFVQIGTQAAVPLLLLLNVVLPASADGNAHFYPLAACRGWRRSGRQLRSR